MLKKSGRDEIKADRSKKKKKKSRQKVKPMQS